MSCYITNVILHTNHLHGTILRPVSLFSIPVQDLSSRDLPQHIVELIASFTFQTQVQKNPFTDVTVDICLNWETELC